MANYVFSLLFLISLSGYGLAASTSIHSTANFRNAIAIGNELDMAFGTIEYTGGAPVAGDRVRLGTDGSIIYNGTVFSGPSTGQAGYVEILSGTSGQTVEIDCTRNGVMANAVGDTIVIRGTRYSELGSEGPWGAGTICNNIGGAPSGTMVLGSGTNALHFGTQIRGHIFTGTISGSYSTANVGGSDIQIDINYQ